MPNTDAVWRARSSGEQITRSMPVTNDGSAAACTRPTSSSGRSSDPCRRPPAFASVRADEWGRTGYRSDGVAFTIDTFTRYMVHDPVHHVWDVQQGYATLDD